MSSPAEKVAGAVGVLAALTAVGGSLGIVLAGPIVNALNWHWLFWLPAIVTADRGGRRDAVRPAVTGAQPRARSAGCPPSCCPPGWYCCWCR